MARPLTGARARVGPGGNKTSVVRPIDCAESQTPSRGACASSSGDVLVTTVRTVLRGGHPGKHGEDGFRRETPEVAGPLGDAAVVHAGRCCLSHIEMEGQASPKMGAEGHAL